MISSHHPYPSYARRTFSLPSCTLRSSFFALLSGSTPSTATRHAREDRLETIRAHMMDNLGERINDYPQLARRIRHAPQIQVLWYLRSDLMTMLAATHGEIEARAKLASLNHMFEGQLPLGLKSRPSPLSD